MHPNYLETIPANTQPKDIIPITSYTYQQQAEIAKKWMATNWSGICDELTKVSNPTLIITENHDNNMPSANSLVIAGIIPRAWLVQIKDAGHALLEQYPDEINKILQTFLSTTSQNG